MKQRTLSVGKRRGLTSTSNERGVFSILAFDHRQSFVDMVTSSSFPDEIYQAAAAVKYIVIQELSHGASAVLTDPLYGAAQALGGDALPAQPGLLVAVEKSGYTGDTTARRSELLDGWGVEKIKRMGADGVKLLIYYHPDGGDLTRQQEDLVLRVVEECNQHDIAFFLEAVTYSLDPDHNKRSAEFAKTRPELIAQVAERLSRLAPEVLKLEFPVDVKREKDRTIWEEACRAVTGASDCPWTVLSAGVDFEVFAEQVEIACEAGASGFIGGRAIWKEGPAMDPERRKDWLKTTAWDRMARLRRIANEKAVSWRKYFPPVGIDSYQGWYQEY